VRLPAIENATLTAVNAAGFTADADLPATTGTQKFTGTQAAFFSQTTERVTVGSGSDVIVRRSLIVDADVNIAFAVGDRVAFTYLDAPSTAVVRRVARTTAPGLPGVTRLTLEDA
jgi:hypothetical protein